jgi:hypothetical protein
VKYGKFSAVAVDTSKKLIIGRPFDRLWLAKVSRG